MFEDAYLYYSQKKDIYGIYGYWKKSAYYESYGGESINLSIFKKSLAEGNSKEISALKTITGQWSNEKLFNNPEFIQFNPTNLDEVKVIFKK